MNELLTPQQQIEREKAAIDNAPRITYGPTVLRCHFCGQPTHSLRTVEVIDGQERKGGKCCAP